MIVELAMALAIQSQTTCRTFMGTTTCDTQPTAGSINAYGAARDSAAASAIRRQREDQTGFLPECAGRMWLLAGCTRGQHDAAVAGLAAREVSGQLRQNVLDRLAADDCEGATRMALEGRDLTLAREVRDFCRP